MKFGYTQTNESTCTPIENVNAETDHKVDVMSASVGGSLKSAIHDVAVWPSATIVSKCQCVKFGKVSSSKSEEYACI